MVRFLLPCSPFPEADYRLFCNRYPVLVDAVVQSNGAGFVGTARSTMSEMAMLRCKTWHKGATRMVDWGRIGADDH